MVYFFCEKLQKNYCKGQKIHIKWSQSGEKWYQVEKSGEYLEGNVQRGVQPHN